MDRSTTHEILKMQCLLIMKPSTEAPSFSVPGWGLSRRPGKGNLAKEPPAGAGCEESVFSKWNGAAQILH